MGFRSSCTKPLNHVVSISLDGLRTRRALNLLVMYAVNTGLVTRYVASASFSVHAVDAPLGSSLLALGVLSAVGVKLCSSVFFPDESI